jgi:acyl-coenzyme A synthetase/AMP-(fatty) acid ligase
LRARAPHAAPFLMYGLTEAFRSTYLPPSEVDRRPDSMGQAIPNAEILVLRPDGSPCAPEEPGELVHRGPLVALGYWGDPEKTAERFRVLPPQSVGADGRHQLTLPEIAVFSGDTVRRDHDGFLYFIGRADAMIKTSGYRVSPQEIEEVVLASGSVTECAAVGLPDPKIGQSIVVFAQYSRPQAAIKNIVNEATQPGSSEVPVTVHRMTQALLAHCRAQLPAYMVPADVVWSDAPLPRNANGKIDRLALVTGLTPSPASEAVRPQGAET